MEIALSLYSRMIFVIFAFLLYDSLLLIWFVLSHDIKYLLNEVLPLLEFNFALSERSTIILRGKFFDDLFDVIFRGWLKVELDADTVHHRL